MRKSVKNASFFLFYASFLQHSTICRWRHSWSHRSYNRLPLPLLLLLLLQLSSVCMCRNQTETLQLDKWVTIQFTSTSEPSNHARPIFPPQSNIPLHQTANNIVSVTCLHVSDARKRLLKQITALITPAAFSASWLHVFTLCDENLIPHS